MSSKIVKTISISAGSCTYRALVGKGILSALGTEAARVVRGPACAVISDSNTARLFGEKVVQALRASNFAPTLITVPAGEPAKSLEQVAMVCEQMAAAGVDRTSFIVAVGGGVVGDLAGFCAAIYHRGVPYVQVPTTLLAQVDSSIGGKTAVNTNAGKNLLGAVYQPALVLADVETLQSLPAREYRQGFAEIIKHAVIADPALFDLVAQCDRRDLTELVARNIAIKAAVVARDDRDVSGQRAVLNFGHTVGHAIERAAGYGTLLHGEAVSLGMVAACEISVRKFGLAEEARAQVVHALDRAGLPTRLPDEFPRDRILPALLADKKFERGEVRFVVTRALGSAELVADVTIDEIEAAVARL